ncbi:hypothetical protein BOTNAR_0020g00190 [Botryotinia narcissicola]|uniref:Uncharacterized protein n=1 Tax=Botryotinia narcissicola TaxID=278944 RepID=A0A4Z1J554_9HELO|nr:hypothetical protein BOTNAR_0020g00190 [Botryotinia narcissicola]
MATKQPPLVVDPDMIDNLSKPSPYTLAEASIPDRIECIVPISVRPSLIDPKNKGLYVDKDVSPGDILFTIEKPLFAIVDGPLFLFTPSSVHNRVLISVPFTIPQTASYKLWYLVIEQTPHI